MPGEEGIVRRGQSFPQTQGERLTAQFYDWEKRGRGWQVWNYPVQFEPPFRPFLGHYAEPLPVIDDGRKPTFLSALLDTLRGSPAHSATATPHADPYSVSEPEEPTPEPFDDDTPLVELQAVLPPTLKISKDAAEQFLLSLKYCSGPLSFEIVGLADSVTVQLACRAQDQAEVRQQLQAHFPEAIVTERPGFLSTRWGEHARTEGVIVDFGLSREFMLPLRAFRGFEVDPLIGTVGALADLRQGEFGLLQVLLQAARAPWAESIMRAVTDWEGRSFFADAPEIVSLAKQKIAHPLFAVVIRVAARSPDHGRAWQICKALGGTLTQFANPLGNELIPLTNDGYDAVDHEHDVLCRATRRGGMLVNLDELTSLVHLPSASVRSAKLTREGEKTKAAPALALGHRLVLGENRHAGKTAPVTLSPEQRVQHTYVIGASGTGKSTLLLNLIIQDILNGEGIAVLDPHGDLIDEVLGHIPESRFGDVVLLDPSDEEYPVGFNILSAHSELEKNLLGSDLVAVFRRLSTSWGDQMTSVLGNAILAVLESTRGGTLADLRRFLIEADFRQAFLGTVRDPEVVYYWQREFPLLTGKPQGPILTRLDTFLRPKLIRHMVCQKENRLDFGAIMNEGKIFLAKLAQGAIGEENAYLLGALLVSKLHQLAMGRQQVAASERRNFYLYIDEFHNFVTPSMAAILSGARKYHLGLILAHQELHQLWNRDTDVASAVISNPYTRVCFRLGDFDAKKLEDGFSFFDARDLQNLEVGEAICRMERSEYDFNLKTLPLPAVEPETARLRRERVIALSRQRYAARRDEVEAYLAKTAPPAKAEQHVPDKPAVKREQAERAVAAPSEPVEPKVEPRPAMPEPQLLGRGGPQHKYLQELIKRWAESKGYKTTIEKQILDGLGSVDVALEKEGRSIACEISVSTTVEHEVGNVQKCLAAGFDHIILISSDSKVLSKASKAISAALREQEFKRVRFVTPERLFSIIEMLEAKIPGREETSQDSDELLTAKEVESLLRIDVKTIYSYVQRGLIPYVRIQSNLRFLKAEILKWVEDRGFKPRPPSPRK
jgi:predicted DNA-binding transcriptional regulator AlpA